MDDPLNRAGFVLLVFVLGVAALCLVQAVS
jgi:hypothetical protein